MKNKYEMTIKHQKMLKQNTQKLKNKKPNVCDRKFYDDYSNKLKK